LIIIGSGIATVGFTATDEQIIQEADKVFYCVADPATNVWLKTLRPDAYDLYVLYDENKVRYTTYMQMTDAMLYYMRQGQKVVGIYYGHPGIFVLSTHRAIQIARREGYRATMRAGISALDTLCADLGVDPSQPGMQTFEATDMLIRARVPDIHVHVVLWQVGLVGELGYRRQGFLNSGFPILLDYLQKYYGKDYPVTNYIGSRYFGIEPTTDVYTLQQLYEPEIQREVTGISTFYLAPKEAAIADEDMMRRLGLLKPGISPKQPTNPLREIDRYGAREMEAFRHFESFKIPRDYQWQEDTAAARFILSLKDDPELRAVYSSSPELALSNGHSSALSDWEKLMLKKRTAGAMQLAAKGYSLKSKRSNNSQFVHDLLCQKVLAKSLQRHFKHQK
ncbi:MAG: SAM-dependent methyltransferase, partial [Microcystaceae cyanobacterium]